MGDMTPLSRATVNGNFPKQAQRSAASLAARGKQVGETRISRMGTDGYGKTNSWRFVELEFQRGPAGRDPMEHGRVSSLREGSEESVRRDGSWPRQLRCGRDQPACLRRK